MRDGFFTRKTALILPGLFLFLELPCSALAEEIKGFSYSVEPIVSYTINKNSGNTSGVVMYGGRGIAGYKILSAELEYTQGQGTELVTSPALANTQTKTSRGRLGLRSAYSLGSILDWYLRAGAEAQKQHISTTPVVAPGVTATTTESDTASYVYPYVGSGISVRFGSKISANASVTATLKNFSQDRSNLKDADFDFAFGLSTAFGVK